MQLAKGRMNRRHFVAAGAAGLLGGVSPVRAQAGFQAPTVDRLTVQVVVDNATFGPFLPNQDLPGLKVQRETADHGPRMSRHALMAEFGLSVLGTSQIGAQTRRVLVDFGYHPKCWPTIWPCWRSTPTRWTPLC